VVARAEISDAREAMTWLVGSVGQASSGEIRALLVVVALFVPLALILNRPLRALELGDDVATALGAHVEACRLGLIAVSIVLVAFAVAAAGPIMFVALMAGPIARHLKAGLLAAAFVGAIIVLGADLVAEHMLPVSLPTGVVTGAIGAPYLIWLLVTANREGRGG
jgi:iron complex transport system permease protein